MLSLGGGVVLPGKARITRGKEVPFKSLVATSLAASCLSYVPEKGTVGASGDLAPLSHLALGLIGEGKMWSPKSGWADAKYVRPLQQLPSAATSLGWMQGVLKGFLSLDPYNSPRRESLLCLCYR